MLIINTESMAKYFMVSALEGIEQRVMIAFGNLTQKYIQESEADVDKWNDCSTNG